jgi:CHASE2 domain-containing sensor protein
VRGLALAVTAFTAAAYRLGWLATAQVRSTDFLFASRGPERARATVLVGIDLRSYRELMPRYGALVDWPCTLYARTLDALARAGARRRPRPLLGRPPPPADWDGVYVARTR